MREEYQLVIFIAISIFIAAISFSIASYFEYGGNLVVREYRAEFFPDGRLHETYEYDVNGHYTMLYRYWEEPLVYNASLPMPYIEFSGINCSYIPYVKDFYGEVHLASDYADYIYEKAFYNEAGCFNPSGFDRGVYKIEYDFILHPLVRYDGSVYHMNIKLARRHIPYKKVEIVIHDENISAIFTHPPMMVEREGNDYVIKGESQKNGLIEFEILLDNAKPDFVKVETNLKEKVNEKNSQYYLHYKIASAFSSLLKAIVAISPVILLAIYFFAGREKKYTVPEYLSFIPRKRKPWLVNLVFKGDATFFDKDGLYATLLDLYSRGIIKIEQEVDDLKIEILKKEGLDAYERKVVKFFEKYGGKAFYAKKFRDRIKRMDASQIERLKKDYEDLLKVKDAEEFIVNGRIFMAKFLLASIMIFIASLFLYWIYFEAYPVLFLSLSFSFFLMLQFLMATIAPSTLFGHWKKDYYKEKLEWDAFRKFLLDMAQLKKYSSQDIIIWKEWLIYATSLGIGKKVAKEMEKLNIELPEMAYVPYIYLYFASINRSINVRYSATHGGGGGGGIGAGGGFGGGGAGGR